MNTTIIPNTFMFQWRYVVKGSKDRPEYCGPWQDYEHMKPKSAEDAQALLAEKKRIGVWDENNRIVALAVVEF